jgi:multisubunit Na+/H+ antiporter MnhB subunit
LIGLLYTTIEGDKKESHEHEKKPEVSKEATVSFHDHFRAIAKERKKNSELVFPTLIGFAVTIIVFFLFPYRGAALEVILLSAAIIGCIVFIFLTLIFKHRITKGFWALWGTRIYIILLICSLALTAYDYYQVHQNFNSSFKDYIAQNLLGKATIPTDGYIFTGEGTVLGSGL